MPALDRGASRTRRDRHIVQGHQQCGRLRRLVKLVVEVVWKRERGHRAEIRSRPSFASSPSFNRSGAFDDGRPLPHHRPLADVRRCPEPDVAGDVQQFLRRMLALWPPPSTIGDEQSTTGSSGGGHTTPQFLSRPYILCAVIDTRSAWMASHVERDLPAPNSGRCRYGQKISCYLASSRKATIG